MTSIRKFQKIDTMRRVWFPSLQCNLYILAPSSPGTFGVLQHNERTRRNKFSSCISAYATYIQLCVVLCLAIFSELELVREAEYLRNQDYHSSDVRQTCRSFLEVHKTVQSDTFFILPKVVKLWILTRTLGPSINEVSESRARFPIALRARQVNVFANRVRHFFSQVFNNLVLAMITWY